VRFFLALSRVALRVGRVSIGWFPPLLVLFFGFLYLWRLFQFFLAPGIPVVIQVPGGLEPSFVRVGSYSVDLEAGSVIAQDIRWYEENQTLAEIESISARRIGGAWQVRGRDLFATLERAENGKFPWERLLPPPKADQPPGPPWVALVDRAEVRVIDRTQTPPLMSVVHLSDIWAEQANRYTTTSAFWHGGLGITQAKVAAVLHESGDSWIQSEAEEFDVPVLVRWANPWLPPDQQRQVESFAAREMLATGTVVTRVEPGKEPRVAANLFVDGTGVAYEDYLANADVEGVVVLRDNQLQTDAVIRDVGRRLDVQGLATLGNRPEWKGRVDAEIRDRRALWNDAAKLLPKNLQFQGLAYRGWVVTDGRDVKLAGSAEARRLTAEGETVTNIAGRVVGNGQSVTAQVARADALGGRWRGAVEYGLRNQSLKGYAKADDVTLGPVARRFDVDGLTGQADASVILGGTAAKPDVRALVDGRARYVTGDQDFDFESVSVRARLLGDQLTVSRFLAETPEGFVVAQGEGNISRQTFNARYQTSALELARFSEEIEGLALVRGEVAFDRGRFTTDGFANVYGLQAGDILVPIVNARIVGDNDQIALRDVQARVRGTAVEGDLLYDVNTGSLDGSFVGGTVVLADWGPETLGGRGQLLAARVTGTLDSPEVATLFSLRDVNLGGVYSASGSLVARLTDNRVDLESFRLGMGGGEMVASGFYDLGTESYILQAILSEARVRTEPNGDPALATHLILDGAVSVQGQGDELTYAVSNLQATDINVGDQYFGSGPINASWQNGEVAFQAEFGTLDRFVVIRDGVYRPGDNVLNAHADLLGFEADALVAAALRRENQLSGDARRILRSLKGDVNVSAEISLTDGDLAVAADDITVSAMEILGRPAGTLTAAVLYGGNEFQVPRLSWSEGITDASVTVREDGYLEGAITVEEFDLIWAQLAYPELNLPSGQLRLSARARGRDEELEGTGEAELTNLVFDEGDQERPASLRLTAITLSPGRVETSGVAQYGDLVAGVGGEYDFDTGTAVARVRAAQIALAKFAEFIPDLQAEGTDGTLDGEVVARYDGVRWFTEGELLLESSRINLTQEEFSLGPSRATITFTPDDRLVTVWTLSQPPNELGAGTANGEVAVNLTPLLSDPTDVESWRDSLEMRANAAFENFRFSYIIPSADGPTTGALSGDLQANGRISGPTVTGELRADGAVVRLPTQPLTETTAALPPVDPEFVGVNLIVAEETRVLAPTLDIRLHGQGTLNGRFTSPTISLPLEVEGGTMTLPSATVTLQPGGMIRVLFSGDSFSQAGRIDLDITGTTILAARRNDRFRTYRVTLAVQGDLLSATDRLNFVATSDPADLSSDEILAIIGQRDLIASLTNGGFGTTDFSRNLASALLPTLTNPSARKLAQELGLDFLYFDYNPFDGAFITLGKVLGRRLTVYARRQLSQPLEGELQYELSVEYDVPTIGGLVRELRLQYQIDQDVPWRIRLDWSRRF